MEIFMVMKCDILFLKDFSKIHALTWIGSRPSWMQGMDHLTLQDQLGHGSSLGLLKKR